MTDKRQATVQITCAECGKDALVKPQQANARKFCGQVCQRKSMGKSWFLKPRK